jgi:hypothetical protein
MWTLAFGHHKDRMPTYGYEPTYANRSLYADVPFALQIRELMSIDPVGSTRQVRKRIRRVIGYCAKLGGRRRGAEDTDLFAVLPTASRQFAAQHRFGSSWRLSGRAATAGAVSI